MLFEKILIQKGNEIEQKYALKLLCQLSFEPRISSDIRNDAEMMSLLNDGKSLGQLKNTILWNIKTNENQIGAQDSSTTAAGGETTPRNNGVTVTVDSEEELKHIMISYNTASRSLCLQVKSFLESIGHRVWIDVTNIHGASLDSMAKAVEGSRTKFLSNF